MRVNPYKGNEPHVHEINTGGIFIELYYNDKWKKISRALLINKYQEALKYTLKNKGIISKNYDESKKSNFLAFTKIQYPLDVRKAKKEKNFPFPDCFLLPIKDSEFCNVVYFKEPCIVKKGEEYYDLFFALQFYVAEIVTGDKLNADEFLQYHFDHTFEKNITKFSEFTDKICLKYSEFLKEKHEPLAKRFIENLHSKENNPPEIPIKIENNNRIKLRWHGQSNTLTHLFRQLKTETNISGEPLLSNSYIEIAQFIQNNFEGFDEVKPSTISGQLKKTVKPKKLSKKIVLYV